MYLGLRSAIHKAEVPLGMFPVSGEEAQIIDAECPCEATTACRHLLVALTSAELDGYHLQNKREET